MSDPVVSLSLSQWIQIVGLGAFSGLSGQAIRVVAGLKKAYDEASAQQRTMAEDFSTSRLLISLLIGAVAGFLALLTQVDASASVSVPTVLAVMAAGYAGTDFIEAFAARYMPSGGAAGAAKANSAEAGSTGSVPSGPAGGPLPADGDAVG